MSHERYQEWLAIYPDLTPREREEVDLHLDTCTACAALRADYRRLRRELEERPTPPPSARLHEAFAAAVARARAEDRRGGLWPRLARAGLALGNAAAWLVVAAIAAVLVLSIAISGPELARRAWPAAQPTATPAPAASGQWVSGHLSLQGQGTYTYRLLIPPDWAGKYEAKEQDNAVTFNYTVSPQVRGLLEALTPTTGWKPKPSEMIFQVSLVTEAGWEKLQQEPGAGKAEGTVDGAVIVSNIAIANPYSAYTGLPWPQVADEFQRLAGQVQGILKSLEVVPGSAEATPTPVADPAVSVARLERLQDLCCPPRFAPDADTYLTISEEGSLLLHSLAGGPARELPLAASFGPKEDSRRVRNAAWTPDGTAIVVTQGPPSEIPHDVYLVDPASGAARRLGQTYSPNRLVFDARGRLVVTTPDAFLALDLASGESTQVPGIAPRLNAEQPELAFSPVGRYVAALQEQELSIVELATGARTPVTTQIHPRWGAGFAWSEDGQQLAYATGERGATPELWVVGADGSGARRIASRESERDTGGAFAGLAWLPGTSTIVYEFVPWSNVATLGGEYQVVSAEGGPAKTLFTNGLGLTLSPDGHVISFVRDLEGPDETGSWIAVLEYGEAGEPATATPAPQSRTWGGYEIRMAVSARDPDLSEVSVHEVQTGDLEFSIAVPDVYPLHYHAAEFHNGHLYIIRRLGYDGYPDEDWTDELWRYDAEGQGSKLYSAQGLDFRVAPAEQGIALTPDRPALVFLDSSGNPVQELAVEQLSGQKPSALRSAHVSPYGWADDGRALWAQVMRGPFEYEFSRVDVASWQVAAYDVAGLPVGSDYALNPSTGLLAYSNAPVQLAADPDETFWESQRQVTLFVRDLAAHSSQPIAASVTRAFRPRWLDDVTLEYNDPTGEGRVVRGIAPAAPGEELTGLFMVDARQGWAVTVAGIQRTEDGGAQWQDVTPRGTTGVYVETLHGAPANVAFSGARAAWLAVPQLEGKISLFSTGDGGQTWRSAIIDTSGAEGRAVTWRPQVLALSFADAQHGWLLASLLGGNMARQDAVLYRTEDGGANWALVAAGYEPVDRKEGPLPGSGLPYTGIKFGLRFVDAQRGWLNGASREDGIWLYASNDGGTTWQQRSLVDAECCSGANGAAITQPPIFFNAGEGVLPVQFHGQGLTTVFYRTGDSGATWEPTTPLPTAAGNVLAWSWADADHGWASAGAGLYATQDGGHTWHLVAPGGGVQGATLLAFVSPRLGWAVRAGHLLRTTDGGQSWEAR